MVEHGVGLGCVQQQKRCSSFMNLVFQAGHDLVSSIRLVLMCTPLIRIIVDFNSLRLFNEVLNTNLALILLFKLLSL